MRMQTHIEQKLQATFTPVHLEVINESSNHSVPPGSETHFKVIVVSEQFQGQTAVARQRLVNRTLAEELQNGVHALAMKVFSPAEWEAAGHVHGHTSPQCAHAKP